MVAATVEVAHGLCFMAFTTTRPSTAMRMIMMVMTPSSAADAADRSQLVARHLAERAAVAAGGEEQDRRSPARSRRAPRRPGSTACPADSRTARRASGRSAGPGPAMAAKWWPNTIHLLVGTKSRPSLWRSAGRGAGRIEHQHPGGDEGAVEAVADGVYAHRGDDEPQAVDGLAARERDAANGGGAEHGDAEPHQLGQRGVRAQLVIHGSTHTSNPLSWDVHCTQSVGVGLPAKTALRCHPVRAASPLLQGQSRFFVMSLMYHSPKEGW